MSFEDAEEPLLASFWRESASCVLTTHRLVWQNGSSLESLAWIDLIGVDQPPATITKIVHEEIAKNSVSTLELFDSAERRYELEVHPGEPYFLIWSVILRFCNFTRPRFSCVLLLAALPLALLLGCTTSLRQARDAYPRIGEPMPRGSSTMGLAHKGRTLCIHWVEMKGIRFSFDVRCGSTTVIFVETTDPDFRTPEGLAIGDSLELAAAAAGSQIDRWDGTCGVLLPSGWIARGDFGGGGRSCGERLNPEQPIFSFERLRTKPR